jgi:GxxExxY protein
VVYRKALLRELSLRGLATQTEVEIQIVYKEFSAGKHRIDIVVGDTVILELKAVSALEDIHTAQALSYLKATGLRLALILNFGGPALVWKRVIR